MWVKDPFETPPRIRDNFQHEMNESILECSINATMLSKKKKEIIFFYVATIQKQRVIAIIMNSHTIHRNNDGNRIHAKQIDVEAETNE